MLVLALKVLALLLLPLTVANQPIPAALSHKSFGRALARNDVQIFSIHPSDRGPVREHSGRFVFPPVLPIQVTH
jgi:hypothetical protein